MTTIGSSRIRVAGVCVGIDAQTPGIPKPLLLEIRHSCEWNGSM
jgi:hypothetical protein